MTLIVVEGIDGSGKSYLVDQFSRVLEDRTRILHRGPLKRPPLEEYVLDLTKQHDPRDTVTLCDRWHVGELIYGPLYRGRSRLTDAMDLYVEHVLDAFGAVKVMMVPEFPVVERRLASRGERFLQPQHRRLVYDAYVEYADSRQGWQVVPGAANPAMVESIVTRANAQALKASEHLAVAPSYVGPLDPLVVFVGSETSMNPLRPRFPTAMAPHDGSFSEYFHQALISAGITYFGITSPDTTALRETYDVLGHPTMIPIGNRAVRKLEDAGFSVPFMVAPKANRVPYTAYGEKLRAALTKVIKL